MKFYSQRTETHNHDFRLKMLCLLDVLFYFIFLRIVAVPVEPVMCCTFNIIHDAFKNAPTLVWVDVATDLNKALKCE